MNILTPDLPQRFSRIKKWSVLLMLFPWHVLFAQQNNYKITYRHCFQSNSAGTLADTIGLEAVLIGNAQSSNYSFLKHAGVAVQQNRMEDILKQKKSGVLAFRKGSPVDSIGNIVFHNKKKDSVFVREMLSDGYGLTSEKTPVINWQIEDLYKQIKGHSCQLATTHFRGRDYAAWFAKDLPIADGPWKFYGLPGLVMDVYDDKNQIKIYVEKIEYPSTEKTPAFIAVGKKMTMPEYFTCLQKAAIRIKESMDALLKNQENLPVGVVPQTTVLKSLPYCIEKSYD